MRSGRPRGPGKGLFLFFCFLFNQAGLGTKSWSSRYRKTSTQGRRRGTPHGPIWPAPGQSGPIRRGLYIKPSQTRPGGVLLGGPCWGPDSYTTGLRRAPARIPHPPESAPQRPCHKAGGYPQEPTAALRKRALPEARPFLGPSQLPCKETPGDPTRNSARPALGVWGEEVPAILCLPSKQQPSWHLFHRLHYMPARIGRAQL